MSIKCDNSRKICLSILIALSLFFTFIETVNSQETIEFEIISVSPKDRVSDYYIDEIRVKFSNDLDFSTINNETFKINPEVPGNFSYNERFFRLTFSADYGFESETEYNITISQNASDTSGQRLNDDYQWSFNYTLPHIHHPILIDFYCEDNSSYIEPGRETTFNITVMNTLCGSGEFNLNHSPLPQGWKCSFSENNFYLASGSERTVNVTIKAPIDAKYDENIKITIYGTTQDDFDEITLYCTVRGRPENIQFIIAGLFFLSIVILLIVIVRLKTKKQDD
jgi:hypothetical protein